MKGHMSKYTGLVDFVLKVVTERHFSEQEIFDAIENASDEMLQNGIVAVGDICNNTLTIPQKPKQYYSTIILLRPVVLYRGLRKTGLTNH